MAFDIQHTDVSTMARLGLASGRAQGQAQNEQLALREKQMELQAAQENRRMAVAEQQANFGQMLQLAKAERLERDAQQKAQENKTSALFKSRQEQIKQQEVAANLEAWKRVKDDMDPVSYLRGVMSISAGKVPSAPTKQSEQKPLTQLRQLDSTKKEADAILKTHYIDDKGRLRKRDWFRDSIIDDPDLYNTVAAAQGFQNTYNQAQHPLLQKAFGSRATEKASIDITAQLEAAIPTLSSDEQYMIKVLRERGVSDKVILENIGK